MQRAGALLDFQRKAEDHCWGDLEQRFTTFYESHYWVEDQSRSGGGSNLYATEKIRKAIPDLFLKYGVRSVLDIPCGDFFWFKEMKLDLDSYIGGDIVVPLIASVAEKYTSPTRSFRIMDLTKDALPDCDLILVRAALFISALSGSSRLSKTSPNRRSDIC